MTFGTTSPTNPIVPEKLTHTAVQADTSTIIRILSLLPFRPTVLENASPAPMTLILSANKEQTTVMMMHVGTRRNTLSGSIPFMDPMLHLYTSFSWSGRAA